MGNAPIPTRESGGSAFGFKDNKKSSFGAMKNQKLSVGG